LQSALKTKAPLSSVTELAGELGGKADIDEVEAIRVQHARQIQLLTDRIDELAKVPLAPTRPHARALPHYLQTNQQMHT
jgi:hypothetical protein